MKAKLAQVYRDLRWAVRRYFFRRWIRYAKRHLLWVNVTRDYLEDMDNTPLWPKYDKLKWPWENYSR